MQKEVKKAIHKYGLKPVETAKDINEVKCTGCGQLIREDDEGEIHFAKAKRGDYIFWHASCTDRIWSTKIPR